MLAVASCRKLFHQITSVPTLCLYIAYTLSTSGRAARAEISSPPLLVPSAWESDRAVGRRSPRREHTLRLLAFERRCRLVGVEVAPKRPEAALEKVGARRRRRLVRVDAGQQQPQLAVAGQSVSQRPLRAGGGVLEDVPRGWMALLGTQQGASASNSKLQTNK